MISSGVRNVYGHPRMEVLNRLEQSKVTTYRTDLNGAVTFYLNGKESALRWFTDMFTDIHFGRVIVRR